MSRPWVDNSEILYDCRIVFRNFSGAPERFNPAGGKRNFSIILEEETALRFRREGWNVKQMKPREGDEEPPPYYLKVNVSFPREGSRGRPPTMVLITSKGRRLYTEEMVEIFDAVEIESADVKIRPFDGTMPDGRTFRTAYMVAIYIKVYEDELARKWADVPEIGANERLAIGPGDDPNVIDAEAEWVDEEIEMAQARKELTA
jgi:hypothetical protein